MTEGELQQVLLLVDSGDPEGVQRLRQIASGGNPEALFVLADLTWSGRLVEQDPPRGRILFEYAAALGHPLANLIATNLLGSGIAGRRDWPSALARLRAEAAKLAERRKTLQL